MIAVTALLLSLPQMRDPEKEKAACASPRACVTSYPTTVVEGMLFAWLEAGPQAEKEAAAQQPYIMPEQVRAAAKCKYSMSFSQASQLSVPGGKGGCSTAALHHA